MWPTVAVLGLLLGPLSGPADTWEEGPVPGAGVPLAATSGVNATPSELS